MKWQNFAGIESFSNSDGFFVDGFFVDGSMVSRRFQSGK
jgi:hypothetical protein